MDIDNKLEEFAIKKILPKRRKMQKNAREKEIMLDKEFIK